MSPGNRPRRKKENFSATITSRPIPTVISPRVTIQRPTPTPHCRPILKSSNSQILKFPKEVSHVERRRLRRVRPVDGVALDRLGEPLADSAHGGLVGIGITHEVAQ